MRHGAGRSASASDISALLTSRPPDGARVTAAVIGVDFLSDDTALLSLEGRHLDPPPAVRGSIQRRVHERQDGALPNDLQQPAFRSLRCGPDSTRPPAAGTPTNFYMRARLPAAPALVRLMLQFPHALWVAATEPRRPHPLRTLCAAVGLALVPHKREPTTRISTRSQSGTEVTKKLDHASEKRMLPASARHQNETAI